MHNFNSRIVTVVRISSRGTPFKNALEQSFPSIHRSYSRGRCVGIMHGPTVSKPGRTRQNLNRTKEVVSHYMATAATVRHVARLIAVDSAVATAMLPAVASYDIHTQHSLHSGKTLQFVNAGGTDSELANGVVVA
jgi:hypothetical protein